MIFCLLLIFIKIKTLISAPSCAVLKARHKHKYWLDYLYTFMSILFYINVKDLLSLINVCNKIFSLLELLVDVILSIHHINLLSNLIYTVILYTFSALQTTKHKITASCVRLGVGTKSLDGWAQTNYCYFSQGRGQEEKQYSIYMTEPNLWEVKKLNMFHKLKKKLLKSKGHESKQVILWTLNESTLYNLSMASVASRHEWQKVVSTPNEWNLVLKQYFHHVFKNKPLFNELTYGTHLWLA